MSRMLVAITIGDPAGVGPELALRLLQEPTGNAGAIPLLFGDAPLLHRVATTLGLSCDLPIVDFRSWYEGGQSLLEPSIIQATEVDLSPVQPGAVDRLTGEASFRFVDLAIDAALTGRVDAVVTGPIHKEAWHAAKVPYPGHTELFAERTGANRYCMMLTAPEITCSLVTAHVGLAEVPNLLTQEGIESTIKLTVRGMRKLLNRDPRIVVCGLNPHAGENGLFGNQEEERIIKPAVEKCRAIGWNVEGPLPADTAFLPKYRATTDAYVCMYHDQGLTVLKALAFDQAVNVTLGLPIVRTSVDHGTALDLAWQGTADISSLVQAYSLAGRLANEPIAGGGSTIQVP